MKIHGSAEGNVTFQRMSRSEAPISRAMVMMSLSTFLAPPSVFTSRMKNTSVNAVTTLAIDADAEPEDDQRRERDPRQAVERQHERRQHVVPERRARQQQSADDAERRGDDERDQRLVDRHRHVAREGAALEQMPELLRDQRRAADPERIDQPDRDHQLPQSEKDHENREAGENHPAAVGLGTHADARTGLNEERVRFRRGHDQ